MSTQRWLTPFLLVTALLCSFLANAEACAQKQVRYIVETLDSTGTSVINDIGANEFFWLVVSVQDIRANPTGVFAAFVDVSFDPQLVTYAGGIMHHPNFDSAEQGVLSNGLIEHAGGLGPIALGDGGIYEVFRIQMQTTSAPGHIRFCTSSPPFQIQHATLVYLSNDDVPPCAITFQTASLRQPPCDFDGDYDCDIDDLNSLLATGNLASGVPVTGGNAQFDLNFDGVIDGDDIDEWLIDAGKENNLDLPYLAGDANLDGYVDGLDFVIWNANKFTFADQWDQGDFNGDGTVDGLDFIIWNGNKFQSSFLPCSSNGKGK